MIKIKIDKSSIKKNPNAGQRDFLVPSRISIIFETRFLIQEIGLVEGQDFDIIESRRNKFNSFVKYQWYNIETLTPEFLKKWNVKNFLKEIEYQRIQCVHPTPSHDFKYENIQIRCNECSNEVLSNEIEEDCNDDWCFTVCPKCKAIESFEKIIYETIIEALKDVV